VRAGDIDVIVVYSLDRLSRDPTHGVILTQELEKHGVKLEAVTEDVDNSELGKLISYIRGYASKLEAEKIKERTVRGRRARAKEGRACGNYGRIYGYDYTKARENGGGRRIINEAEAKWVTQVFHWLVNDGMSTSAIRDKLVALNVPTKTGSTWCRSTVIAICKNPAYAGKTYAFTTDKGKLRGKPQEDWIELPNVTPAIISQEVFDAAQNQLQVNRAKCIRNRKRQYLLAGHVKCRQCGHAYCGDTRGTKRPDGTYTRVYRCVAKWRAKSPLCRCRNRNWRADKLEAVVWAELERYLSDRDLIVSELEKQRNDANQLGVFESQLRDVERQLKAVDREQRQLLQWALKGFPESQVEAENRRLNKARETLRAQITELEAQIKASQDAVISIPKLEDFIERMQDRIATLDFEGKRQVLDMLGITVWLDGDNIEIAGVIDVECGIVTTPSCINFPLPLIEGEGDTGDRVT
jgi:site-specific DNA recombinase